MKEWFQEISDEFVLNFIKDNRWEWIVEGLKNTLIITFFATLIGIAIGIIIATVRSTYDKNYETMKKHKGLGFYVLSFFNFVCKLYLTVIRGTPVVVQLLIMYFIILSFSNDEATIAIITFGINSGAYVAEIFRSGVMSIDKGQFEAGSTTTASSFLPKTPPFLFCSSTSINTVSFKVVSEIAMVPDSECNTPILMVSSA